MSRIWRCSFYRHTEKIGYPRHCNISNIKVSWFICVLSEIPKCKWVSGSSLVLFIHLLVSDFASVSWKFTMWRIDRKFWPRPNHLKPCHIATLYQSPLDVNIWLPAQQRRLAFWTVQSPLYQWKHYILWYKLNPCILICMIWFDSSHFRQSIRGRLNFQTELI